MKKVLLIDDDPITNFINKKLIENTGLAGEILVAQSGMQGLEILVSENKNGERFPDLIVVDINMPVLNGFEFLHHLYKLDIIGPMRRKIAILSSSDRPEDKAQANQLGIEDYLVKPATSEAFIGLLQ